MRYSEINTKPLTTCVDSMSIEELNKEIEKLEARLKLLKLSKEINHEKELCEPNVQLSIWEGFWSSFIAVAFGMLFFYILSL